MIQGTTNTPFFPNTNHHIIQENVVSSSSSLSHSHQSSLLYNLSLLKEKVDQVQSLATMFISDQLDDQTIISQQYSESTAMAISSMGTLIQEIITSASSLMFSCQKFALEGSTNSSRFFEPPQIIKIQEYGQVDPLPQRFYSNETLDHGYEEHYTSCNNNTDVLFTPKEGVANEETRQEYYFSPDIIELDAADLLAKYTHYCQVCGKGFKRDANLRMHMRAHGDEYKSSAALSNPLKNNNGNKALSKMSKKYSCPQEGCRWNRKHDKFQPLKSMICVKNHYKRSHCPKLYVCKRCNKKQFSVLSDLRTHEKHCGDLKWQCSCGTTFSRKDKLMGHVSLFLGHTPLINT